MRGATDRFNIIDKNLNWIEMDSQGIHSRKIYRKRGYYNVYIYNSGSLLCI